MEFLGEETISEDDVNKDYLLIKCKEVIESLNSEIEQERIAYKIIKEENDRLKGVDEELYKIKQEYQEAARHCAELEDFCEENKAQNQAFFEKINLDLNREIDPYLCTCHELKAEGFSSDYKCVYCLFNKQLKIVKTDLNQKFKTDMKTLEDKHKEEITPKNTKISELELMLKTATEEIAKANKQEEEYKGFNEDLNSRLCRTEEEFEKTKAKCREMEEQLKHFSVDVTIDHNKKIQELETQVEREKMITHERKLEIVKLEEENLILTSKVDEIKLNEIELTEKISKLQESHGVEVEDLKASRTESKNKWKQKFKETSKELDLIKEEKKELGREIEKLKENAERAEEQYNKEITDFEDTLAKAKEEIEENIAKVETLHSDIKNKNKIIHHQKTLINKLASEKDDMALDYEKNSKMYEVALNDNKNKIDHLQIMIEKYKKVIDKADNKLKQLPQEFALEMVSMKKKLKREKDAAAQQEIRKLKRELLEKELQWKRQLASIKTQEVKAFTEWDLNSFHSQPQDNVFTKSCK